MKHPSVIQKDFYRESGKWLSTPQIWMKCINPNLHFVYILRKCQQHPKKSIQGFFWRLVLRKHQIKYGFQIYPETQIGEGFYLGHWGALVINPNAKIGKNCNIAQGVTIGQQNRGKNEGYPEIGNHVWIGANATILKGVEIGEGSIVSAETLVTNRVGNQIIICNEKRNFVLHENITWHR